MRNRIVFGVLMLLASFSVSVGTTYASSPLVNVAWVKQNIGRSDTAFIDLRSKVAYLGGHVPGAVHSSYKGDKWRQKKGDVKGMLPPSAYLEKLIGRLGIDNDTHVVLMHGGYSAVETGVATRVYWTFKVLGHDNVSILDGGMTAYLSDKSSRVEKVAQQPVVKTFKVHLNTKVLASSAEVEDSIKAGGLLLDSRPSDQHMGVNKSGAITRTGTLPGAVSVPGRWVTVNDKGTFRSLSALKKIYSARAVSENKNRIVFCNTGHWASLGWFVDSELLGNKQSKVYDGSMAQWSRLTPENHPMEVKLNLQ